MGIGYSSTGGTALNTILHHWLIKKQVFKQAVKSDPILSALYSRFMKVGGIGQTDIVKLHMGDNYQPLSMAEGGSFLTHSEAGAPTVVDSSTIPNKLITCRLSMTGTQKRALEKSPEKISGGTMNDVTRDFVDMLKMNLIRMAAGDGTGKITYATGSSSSTTMTLKDDNGATIDDAHWAWNFLYPGHKVDFVPKSTGVLANSDDGSKVIYGFTPASGTVTVGSAIDTGNAVTTSMTGTSYYMRYYTDFSTNGTQYTTATFVEPRGIAGMVYVNGYHPTGITDTNLGGYLGKAAATYPRWDSYRVNANSVSLNVKLLDKAIYASKGTPDTVIMSPGAISQLRYEADAMKKLAVRDDMTLGQPALYYWGPKGWVKMIDSYMLGQTGRCYILDTKTFLTKGTVLEPTPLRGQLELLQTSDVWFDDWMFEFENICVQRNANGYIYGLTEAF